MKKTLIIVVIILSNLFGAGILDNYDSRFERSLAAIQPVKSPHISNRLISMSSAVDTVDSIMVYPARPMLMSLVLPGLGQYYNKSPWWKTTLFAGIEVVGIVGYWKWTQKAEDIRKKYESFAIEHWDIDDWVYNTPILKTEINQYLITQGYDQIDDLKIEGTHHLFLYVDGAYISSDTLAGNPNFDYGYVLEDRDFFENIGKYDQFVGGWDDVEDWEVIFKDVGDSTEIIITTPNKDKYLDQREESNNLLSMAKYAISAIMFNHVISALDAVWSSQNPSRKEKEVKTSLGLMYDRQSKYGIGGLSLVVRW